MPSLIAGAAIADITPTDSQFLYGYPHVERHSTGVHDPLLAQALYLSDGQHHVIFISKQPPQRVRQRIAQATDVPQTGIMVTATHTHSGPITVNCLMSAADP